MKTHEEIKNIIELWTIDELNDSEKELLHRHLSGCSECKSLFETNKKLFAAFNAFKKDELGEELASNARMELRAALRNERNKKSFAGEVKTKIDSLIFGRPLQIAYAMGILIVGFMAGMLVDKDQIIPAEQIWQENIFSNLLKENFSFQNINILSKDELTGEYEFQFDAIKRVTLSGEKDAELVQKLLIYSIQNETNPGTRLNSINFIREKENLTVDAEIKAVLITTVKSDSNSGVRREALKLLTELPFDDELKSAFLFVLSHDENSGLRIEAMRSLIAAYKNGKITDENFKENLNKKIQSEENSYIKILATSL